MAVELKVPKVGDSITEVEIGEWLKSEGDTVQQDETVVTLDTAKAAVDLPSPISGTITKLLKQAGDVAEIGEVIAHMEEGAAAGNGQKSQAAAPSTSTTSTSPPVAAHDKEVVPVASSDAMAPRAEEEGHVKPDDLPVPQQEASHVMPAAARVLAENNLNAAEVAPSGPGARLLKEDVQRHIEGRPQGTDGAPAVAPATPQSATQTPASTPDTTEVAADEEVVPMSMLRREIARRLVEAQQTAALLTTFNEIDMSAVMALRKEHQDAFVKKYDIKLGFMSFFVKAVIDGLKAYPAINAEIRGRNIVYKNHYDIGVAIGSGKGLVVPVLRHAERMSFAEIEKAIADYAQKVKGNKITPDDLLGGTFTITNGGVYGSLLSTPIVNPPQSGILGMHSIQERPVAVNGQVVIRPMMYVALTYDHRVVDGREAVSFLKRVADCVQNPTRMLIEV